MKMDSVRGGLERTVSAMQQTSKLKPCPFCGGESHMITRVQAGVPSGDDGYTTVIKCLNHAECGAVICRWALKKKWSVESAIKAWNRRANDDI
jgi:Lar family restriction alleviation protein